MKKHLACILMLCTSWSSAYAHNKPEMRHDRFGRQDKAHECIIDVRNEFGAFMLNGSYDHSYSQSPAEIRVKNTSPNRHAAIYFHNLYEEYRSNKVESQIFIQWQGNHSNSYGWQPLQYNQPYWIAARTQTVFTFYSEMVIDGELQPGRYGQHIKYTCSLERK